MDYCMCAYGAKNSDRLLRANLPNLMRSSNFPAIRYNMLAAMLIPFSLEYFPILIYVFSSSLMYAPRFLVFFGLNSYIAAYDESQHATLASAMAKGDSLADKSLTGSSRS